MKISGDCPNCKEKVSIDIDKLEMKAPKELQNASTETNQVLLEKPKPEIKEVIKIEKVAPSDSPFYTCSDGNCEMDGLHKNKNYTKRPKEKCKNCESLNGSKKCKNCGNKDENEFETLEAEELDDLGIPEPLEKEHTHED